MSVAESVPEKDKPFYIAIMLIILAAIILIAGLVGAAFDKQLVLEYVREILGSVITLVTAAVTYYFGSKK